MRCPACGSIEDRVVDSRQTREGDLIRRRRECVACSERFTTYERLEPVMPMVAKKDGRVEPYQRDKVTRSLFIACQKRSALTKEVLEAIVDRVEDMLATCGVREVTSHQIGEFVIDELRALDGVAYLRFASVYHSYETVDEFIHEVSRVRGGTV